MRGKNKNLESNFQGEFKPEDILKKYLEREKDVKKWIDKSKKYSHILVGQSKPRF